MTDTTAPRTAISGLRLQLGLVTVPVDAAPLRRSEAKSGFNMRCLVCDTPTRVRQAKRCENGHELDEDTIGRGKELADGSFVAVSDEEYEATKAATVKPGAIDLQVVPADQLDGITTIDDAGYYLRAVKKVGTTDEAYSLMRMAAERTDVALVGEMTVRGSQKLYRLMPFKGALVLRSLIRPDDLNAFTDVPEAVEPNPRYVTQLDSLLASLRQDFDPTEFANTRRQRVEELMAAKAADPNAVIAPPADTPATTTDLMAALEASVAAAKASKKPAKPKAKAKKDAAA